MFSNSQDSTSKPRALRPSSKEQDVIHQTQAELLTLIRFAPDEAMGNWQKPPLRMGGWSSTLESEICSFLW